MFRVAVVVLFAASLAAALAGCETYVRNVQYVEATNADKAGNYKAAADLYRAVANSDDYKGRQAAQFRLAEMTLEGQGTIRNVGEALRLWQTVATGPDATWRRLANYRLGDLHETGVPNFLPQDRGKAALFYAAAAKDGDPNASRTLSRLQRHPDVYVLMYPERFKQDESGIAPAGIAAAYAAFKANDQTQAFRIFLWHAKNGSAEAQIAIAMFYKNGFSVPVDRDLYKAWTFLAAKNGNRSAQFELGLLYYDSEDVPWSDSEAETWLRRAANQGHIEALNSLGILLLHPHDAGKASRPEQAAALFQRAATDGSINATVNLGDVYLHGLGVTKDRERAKQYYVAAAAKGNLIARRRLFEEFDIAYQPGEETSPTAKAPAEKMPAEKTTQRPTPVTAVLPPPPQEKRTTVEIYAQLTPSVLRIVAVESKRENREIAQGSAVVIAPRLAATNCHVLEGKDAFVALLAKDVVIFRLARADKKRDICIIRGESTFTPVRETRSYADLKVGEHVYAIGSPKGLENTFSEGIISGLREIDGIRYIQMSAPISHGSSGGGLFDENGKLIGITTSGLQGGGNLNFAVAVDEMLQVSASVK